MITGIEKIDRAKQKAILAFISSEFELDDAIRIEEEDSDIININGTRYFMIRPWEEDDLMDDLNTQRFEAAFENLSDDQKKYVDEDKWKEDKGVHDFLDWLREELDELPSEDFVSEGGYNFYEL